MNRNSKFQASARASTNVGDVIAIYRYDECKQTGNPSAIGVVLKTYKDNRCFVKLLRNYTIPKSKCQNWHQYGCHNYDGYYVRLEDRSSMLYHTEKHVFHVGAAQAVAMRSVSRSDFHPKFSPEYVSSNYLKNYPETTTEIYYFDAFNEIIPHFVMMWDNASSDKNAYCEVVFEKYTGETFKSMVNRAYARIQINRYKDAAK